MFMSEPRANCRRSLGRGREKPQCDREKPHRGFSLVELLVVLTIISLITMVVIARYRDFDSTILLRNLAYEIALSVREAQTLGISVQNPASSTGNPFNYAYGVHFARGTSYMLFADLNTNGQYDSGEEISSYTIGKNNGIARLYANNAEGTTEVTTLDVLFRRPEPDARFTASPAVPGISSVRVIIASQKGTERTIEVWTTGQIAVR